MKAYLVGGAVRDALLGRTGGDRDWVVVGSTPRQMMDAGYTPVGQDFPVFLHPQSREEYALARTERKTAPGYRGFAFRADPSVTLEDDLSRRDLTINAMAMDADGSLIDPHGGRSDLQAGVLRHVSPAFCEDPVRILRLARFAARYDGFTVAEETMCLARSMVEQGEVDALVPERVWQELSRGLMETRPSNMFRLLDDCAALVRLLPELRLNWTRMVWTDGTSSLCAGDRWMRALDLSAALSAALPARFACTFHDLDPLPFATSEVAREFVPTRQRHPLLAALCERLRVPGECRALAELIARESAALHACLGADASQLLRLLESCDALRRRYRFESVLLVCECDARSWPGARDAAYPQSFRSRAALQSALAVDSGPVAAQAARQGLAGSGIGQAIHEARIAAIARDLPRRTATPQG